MSYCKHFGQQVNQGTWWCNRQFDKDFLKTLNQEELDMIYCCNCNGCHLKEPVCDEWKVDSAISWEKVSEI